MRIFRERTVRTGPAHRVITGIALGALASASLVVTTGVGRAAANPVESGPLLVAPVASAIRRTADGVTVRLSLEDVI